jgi:molybdopterin-containing oxidoreductase family iron-sulfur binding subunit
MSDDSQTSSPMDRRRFLTVLGATSAGAAALSGCSTDRVEKLIPYLVQSEDQVPGIPTWYASTCTECRAGCGVHVKTREGRAIKLEGNPEHPVNQGRICSKGQSALQGLYNPGRLRGPMARTMSGFKEITWDDAIGQLAQRVGTAQGKIGIISGAGRGSFSDLLAEWTSAVGGRLVRYDAFDSEPLRLANQRIFGRDELAAHDFGKAKYIVSFGADFLESWGAPVENQRGFAESHGFSDKGMSKFVYVAPRASLTGLNADQFIAVKPGSETALALAMANLIGAPGADLSRYTPEMAAQETGIPADTIRRLAKDFADAKPSLAVAGGIGSQHAGAEELCAAVNLLNYAAGNIGQTVRFGADLQSGDGQAAIDQLAQAMDEGQLAVVLVHESNPVYTQPKASGFAAKFRKVPFKVSTSLYLDETASECDLLLPNSHALERWDDARPRAGVASLMQPVMEPVFKTLPTGDLLLKVAQKVGGPLAKLNAPSYEVYLKRRWAELARTKGAGDADQFWREALARGGVFDTTPAPVPVKLASAAASYTRPSFEGGGDFVFLPHVTTYGDGRFTNRPWILELSDPVTKITWTSWVEVSPATAKRLNVREGEILKLTSPHGTIEAPAYVYAGLRDDVVSVPLGFGHTAYGDFASGRGVNALDLLGGTRQGAAFLPYVSTTVRVERTGGYRKLPKTEGNPRQLGRGIAEAIPVAAAEKGLTVLQAYILKGEGHEEVNTETEVEAIKGWRERQVEGRKLGDYAREGLPMWGMAIDLARCTGCSACVTACYAENNIPWVGEDDVLKGREMTWLRIERYWEGGDGAEPLEARFVPMLCQHCDNAPCEPVCPVYAAYHTPDGLNGQVYNRCVGTRYCGNNCPYKVRYFNWYKYNERAFPEPMNLQLNPDVTVRARGVMEKCTFCVQRIRGAQHAARIEDRPLKDGDVVTACAQACPSNAITFGNMKDPASRVAQLKQNPRGYHVLEEVNTRPAVTYLAKVLNRAEA